MALIPPFYIDTVVALGTYDDKGEPRWTASGFLYGDFSHTADDNHKYYRVYLVTNRHVVDGEPRLCLRCNPQAEEPAHTYDVDLLKADGSSLWFASPRAEADVAVVPINVAVLREHGMKFGYFRGDQDAATIDRMNELGITEGDFAYVLGFPMGLIGGDRNFVIVRSGSIARVRDALNKTSQEFLVDAFVFPGNSGGPVILKPELARIEGTSATRTAHLIGVVARYVPYTDVAVSMQTKRPRVIFEENSGLTAVQPIDFVQEAIQEHRKTLSAEGGSVATATEAEAPPGD